MAFGKNKKYVFYSIFIFIVMVFMYQLFKIQLVSDKYYNLAIQNTSDKITLYPSRGNIYDRNGKLMAYNAAVLDLIVFPKKLGEDFDKLALCDLLEMDTVDFNARFKKAKKAASRRRKDNSFTGSAVFLSALSPKVLSNLQEEIYRFPGFLLEIKSDRRYKTKGAAHLLGYLREVSPKNIANDPYYSPGDLMGVNGVEYSYEKWLRGKKGVRNVLVDNFSIEKGAFAGGKFDTAAVAGKDLISSLDIDLQLYGEELLKGKRGSIVAIEPSTGEILAMVNFPTYDPTLLTGKDRGKNYNLLLKDKNKPFYNRAVLGKYPPGSTFKTIMALIGQEEGVCTPETRYACHGGYRLGSLTIGCHPHPSGLNLYQSIQQSCNAWYCSLFRGIVDNSKYNSTEKGFNVWREHLNSFGIGDRLGVDIPSESKGFIPQTTYYDRIYGENRWRSSTILSVAIGQGEIGMTPLQMANMCAVIANRGFYIIPHAIKSIGGEGVKDSMYLEKHYSTVSKKYYEPVIEGMSMVYESGTARGSIIKGISMCGKTGTAQNPHGKDHSIFIAFAPRENPQIAIAVLVENGGYGSTYAAPIASLMMEKYIQSDSATKRPDLYKRLIETNLIDQNE